MVQTQSQENSTHGHNGNHIKKKLSERFFEYIRLRTLCNKKHAKRVVDQYSGTIEKLNGYFLIHIEQVSL